MGFGGFFKGLGKGLLKAAPFIPIPGVPQIGKTAEMIKGAKNLAPVLGGMAASKGKSNAQTDVTNIDRDRLALERFRTGLDAPGKRLNTSLRASRVSNAQPVKAKWGGPGSGLRGETMKFEGGYNNPNIISRDTRAMADDIIHQQMMEQMSGGGVPVASKPAGGGIMDKILGGAATGASILGAMGGSGGGIEDEEVPPRKFGGAPTAGPFSNVRF